MAKNKAIATSDFYCTECGKKGIPIMRRNGRFRKGGHLKKLYCLYCKQETNHCEIRPFGMYTYEDFKQEFTLGRFVDGVRVPLTELKQCGKVKCQYCINHRCWNYNKSLDCKESIV